MKFGKSIGLQQDGNLSLHYVDYKLLKKKIKDVLEQLEAHDLNKALRANSEFERELEAEIEQVNTCFAETQKELLEQTGSLSKDLLAHTAAKDSAGISAAAASGCSASSPPEAEAGDGRATNAVNFRGLVAILEEVDQLRKYAVWNAVAVVKILKKRRKQTHFGLEDMAAERQAWLSRQTFFSGSDFAELHATIESLGHMLVFSELMPVEFGARRPQPQLEQEAQQCPICLDTISDMVELSCNHRFCWKCFVLGPIANQPGEYRITQCPICRMDTSMAATCGECDTSGSMSGVALPTSSSEGILTRFLHTYFPKDILGQGEGEFPDTQSAHESEREMRDVVSELVRALMTDSALIRPVKAPGMDSPQLEEPGSGAAAASSAPSDFFQTLPHRSPEEKQIGAAQKLQWLQLASTGDSFALDGTMYCSLCSEPLLMEAVVTTPCKHHFHRICINRLEEPKCPLCSSQLPFSWFIPEYHPCAEHGFRVVPTHEYKPRFPGGPSRGSHGFPLHRPPPVSICGPGGMTMKSYLHKVVPMGKDKDLDESSGSPHNGAAASSASESSSEESNSDDGGENALGHSSAKKNRAHSWAYSAMGRMRLVEEIDRPEVVATPAATGMAPPACEADAGRARAASGASASSSDVAGGYGAPVMNGQPNGRPGQRNPTVLLIGKHL